MTSTWIEGCVVKRVSFRDDLVLDLDHHSELVISVPMRLTLPEVGPYSVEVVTIDATSVPPHLRPLLGISGATCTHASWDEAGHLHLEFSGGHQIDVPFSEHTTAWELYGKHHGYVACLPRGDMRIVRHDLPQDAESAQRAPAGI
jgi:uncharacterized protein DUF6188